jgi:hypothetical protein
MRSVERRIQRVEELVNEDEGLTEADFDLILSCLPKEVADAVLTALFATGEENHTVGKYDHFAQRSGKTKERTGLHGKTLELIMTGLPPECTAALKAKVTARGI